MGSGLPGLGYVVNWPMVNKSPFSMVVPLPNGRTPWLTNGDPITTYNSWDDVPSRWSRTPKHLMAFNGGFGMFRV